MSQTALEPLFPFAITFLCYLASSVLVLILFLLILINSKLSALNAKLARTSYSAKIEDADATPDSVEVHSGTHFEEFLNEDPERRQLTKKEQFKAYRAWRSEKGLNWAK